MSSDASYSRAPGSALYHPVKIGSLQLEGNLFLAPVAGYSDRAFRSLCIEFGASFTYTEMVSSEALTRGSGKTEKLLQRAHNETKYAVQIFGSDPERMADAASMVADEVSPECIDINAGCPVPKIWKNGAGSALTRDPDRLACIVRAVTDRLNKEASAKNASPIPVSVKIRSGWDDSALSWKEAAKAAVCSGAAAITLHPRTRAQGYEGKADWSILSNLSDLIHGSHPGIPVFGSGDLFTPESAKNMLEETGCDGVMFARGAMGNPFIFRQAIEYLAGGAWQPVPAQDRIEAGWRELRQLCEDSGETAACREMRKRFCAYSKGLEGGATLRLEIVKASSMEDYRNLFASHGFVLS